MMPATIEEFIAVMSVGERALWSGAADNLASTAPQAELLGALIPKFNGAGTVEERFILVAHFLVEAAQIEAADGSVTRYDLYQVN